MAEINLATLSCDKYENQIIGSTDGARPAAQSAARPTTQSAAPRIDAIDTVMWLFGFSVAKAGEHVMYGEALASFGFALDAECKNNPSASLLEAVTAVRPNRDKPMDLTTLNCAAWEARHAQSAETDPESATTIMMWLYASRSGARAATCSIPAAREVSRPRCRSAAISIPTIASSMPCQPRPRAVGPLRRADEAPSDCSPPR